MTNPNYTEIAPGIFATDVYLANGSSVASVSTAGVVIPAVALQQFNITYIDISAENNDGAIDSIVSVTATIGGVVTTLATVIVPIGVKIFSVTKSLVTNIITDTATAINVTSTSANTIFSVSVGGFYI